MQTLSASTAGELATVVREGFVESRHLGAVVVLDPAGRVTASIGDPSVHVFPRSLLKPMQAIASMNAGAELQGAQIALACGSHVGSFEHMKVAQAVLVEAGLSVEDLQLPAAWPADQPSYHALVRAGHDRQKLAMECSGKHAAFLWGCVKSQWPTENYLSPEHPLQQLVVSTTEEMTGEQAGQIGTDGCGAPMPATSLLGLARAYSTLGAGIENIRADARVATVATAMVDYPEYVQGHGKPATALMQTLDAVAKNGTEGLLAIGLRSGASVVVKTLDGSTRPTALVAVRLLQACGFIDDSAAQAALDATLRPIRGGGEPVGSIEPGVDLHEAITTSRATAEGSADQAEG